MQYNETPIYTPIPAANKPSRRRSTGRPVGAVLHWMVGYLPGTDATFRNPATGYATNEGIGTMDGGRTWEIHQYVGEDEVAWGNGNDDLNDRAESIELANDRAWGPVSKPPSEVHELAARRLADLAIRHNWFVGDRVQLVLGDWPDHDFYGRRVPGFGTAFNVITHRSVALKDCPGTTDIWWIVDRGNQIIDQRLGRTETPRKEEDEMPVIALENTRGVPDQGWISFTAEIGKLSCHPYIKDKASKDNAVSHMGLYATQQNGIRTMSDYDFIAYLVGLGFSDIPRMANPGDDAGARRMRAWLPQPGQIIERTNTGTVRY